MKIFSLIAAILCLIAAIVMYLLGNSSGHLTELKSFFWVPLPLGVLLFAMYLKKN